MSEPDEILINRPDPNPVGEDGVDPNSFPGASEPSQAELTGDQLNAQTPPGQSLAPTVNPPDTRPASARPIEGTSPTASPPFPSETTNSGIRGSTLATSPEVGQSSLATSQPSPPSPTSDGSPAAGKSESLSTISTSFSLPSGSTQPPQASSCLPSDTSAPSPSAISSFTTSIRPSNSASPTPVESARTVADQINSSTAEPEVPIDGGGGGGGPSSAAVIAAPTVLGVVLLLCILLLFFCFRRKHHSKSQSRGKGPWRDTEMSSRSVDSRGFPDDMKPLPPPPTSQNSYTFIPDTGGRLASNWDPARRLQSRYSRRYSRSAASIGEKTSTSQRIEAVGSEQHPQRSPSTLARPPRARLDKLQTRSMPSEPAVERGHPAAGASVDGIGVRDKERDSHDIRPNHRPHPSVQTSQSSKPVNDDGISELSVSLEQGKVQRGHLRASDEVSIVSSLAESDENRGDAPGSPHEKKTSRRSISALPPVREGHDDGDGSNHPSAPGG